MDVDGGTVNIAPEGDVIMVVGPKKKEFRVHSCILKDTSKVFNAMLGPNFSEGRQLMNNDHSAPVKIKLPGDNVEGIEATFNLLHCRADLIPSPQVIPFFEMAEVADKYDLVEALKYAVQGVMSALRADEGEVENMNSTQLWKWAMAAAHFGDDSAFRAATRGLVMQHTDAYISLAIKWHISEVLALRACGYLEEQRSELRKEAVWQLLWACDRDSLDTDTVSHGTLDCLLGVLDSPAAYGEEEMDEAVPKNIREQAGLDLDVLK